MKILETITFGDRDNKAGGSASFSRLLKTHSSSKTSLTVVEPSSTWIYAWLVTGGFYGGREAWNGLGGVAHNKDDLAGAVEVGGLGDDRADMAGGAKAMTVTMVKVTR